MTTHKLVSATWRGAALELRYVDSGGKRILRVESPRTGTVSVREAAMALQTYPQLLYRLRDAGGLKLSERQGQARVSMPELRRLRAAWAAVPPTTRLLSSRAAAAGAGR